jgi:hypothetical protein
MLCVPARRILAPAVLLFAIAAGCGTVIHDSGSEGGRDAGGEAGRDAEAHSEAGLDVGACLDVDPDSGVFSSPVCPETQPTLGSPCSVPDATGGEVRCEYGQLQYDVRCDTVLECVNGAWANAFSVRTPSAGGCQPDGCNPSACPSTLSALMAKLADTGGDTCFADRCEYPDGVCYCGGFGGPPPPRGSAGWMCEPQPAGCPMPRPRLGAACTTPSRNPCSYLPCEFTESCADGFWHGELAICVSPPPP